MPVTAELPGTWNVRAAWPGNSDYLASEAVGSFVVGGVVVEKGTSRTWLVFLVVGVVVVLGAATAGTLLVTRRHKRA